MQRVGESGAVVLARFPPLPPSKNFRIPITSARMKLDLIDRHRKTRQL